MKILYFTGTGNCLSVAKKFNAELLSFPKIQKSKDRFRNSEVTLNEIIASNNILS